MTLNKHDAEYHKLVQHVLSCGRLKTNRTGVAAYSVFGAQMRFDLRDGSIPMLTTKKMFTRGVIREILWYLMGTGNIKYLTDHNVHIWDEWADQHQDLGPVYGVMWRKWPRYNIVEWDNPSDEPLCYVTYEPIDQIANLIDCLRNNPSDRRMIVSGWNPEFLPDPTKSFDENVANGNQALPPCHYTFQCSTQELSVAERMAIASHRTKYTTQEMLNMSSSQLTALMDGESIPKYELSLLLNQRSCDVGLGVPFNIVQYSILLRMLAHVVNMVPGDFVWSGGDVHIYQNHVTQLRHQMTLNSYNPPTLSFSRPISNIDDFEYDDFIISNYQSHPTISMDVAV